MSSPLPTWGQMSSPRPTWGQMSSPRPTWGRPPPAVPPSAARLVSFVQEEKSSRCRACRKKTSPTTAHVGADVLTTAHVGTAALGRPAERSSASQLCPRREIISVSGLSQENQPYHGPRGDRRPHHGPRGGRCPHHGPRGDGRPRPSRRAQLGQSALSQKRNHL